jgi:hypothetical protein
VVAIFCGRDLFLGGSDKSHLKYAQDSAFLSFWRLVRQVSVAIFDAGNRFCMKKLLLVLVCALPFFAAAQSPITITNNDMPEPGDTLRVSNTDALFIDVSSTGANHVWDYRNLQPFSQDRSDYVYSLQTVYAFYFLGVNQYGTKIADSLGGGPFQFTDVYNFYRSATNDFRAEGVGFRNQGIPLAAYYSDEDELFQFPLDYLDRDTTTYRFSVDLGTGLSFSQQGTRYNEVDGWGVIMTPYDSIECLRVVSETDGVDSVSFNGFQFGIANVQRSIKFLANGVHIPILEITGRVQMGNFQPQRAKYRDEYRNLVATAEPRSTGIRFYPNPAQNFLTIESELQESLLLTVTDMQGKTIASQSLEGTVFVHSVAEYPNGVYLMRITTLDGAVIETAKIVVGGR